MNPLLYGHNPKERVVSVHQLNDKFIRLYSRTEGKVQSEDIEFFPFFFLSDPTLLKDFPKQFWLKELSGGLFFSHVAAFGRWSEMWEAVNYAIRTYNKHSTKKASQYHEVESLLLKPDPVYQFLLQSGITLFKGMEFDDLYRLQIDVQKSEQIGPGRQRSGYVHVERIVLSDNLGWDEILEPDKTGEAGLFKSFGEIVRNKDPDILEGHYLHSEILPLLVSRCESLSFDLPLGRDGTSIRLISPRQQLWSPESEFGFFEIAGRHTIDTARLAETYDNAARSLDNFDLEYLSRQFGLDEGGLPQNESTQAESAREKQNKTKRSVSETVHRVRSLSRHLSLSSFYLTQFCPFNFGALARIGSAAKIESLLLREYLRQKHSLPKPQTGTQTRGGYADIYFTGLFSRILHADVESLYPSIMISQSIRPRSDLLDIFIPLLSDLTRLRLEAKRTVSQSSSVQEHSRREAFQSALKILINSFYGYLAYARALFNDYEQADRLVSLGQQYLRSIIEQARLFNAQVIEVDTDGLYFTPPDNVVGEENEELFVKRLSSSLPSGINLVLAGRFAKMLSYRKKNYALLDTTAGCTIRGSSLISRSLEPFIRSYIEKCIELLLAENFSALHHLYTAWHRKIAGHQWHVREFSRYEVIKEEFDAYDAGIRNGERQISAAYEAARRAGIYPKLGMTIRYYVTGSEANIRIADHCRIEEEWDANLPDENSPYYLSRLGECSAKFKDFFNPPVYEKIFSVDDLFGFDPAGITIINHEVQAQKTDLPPDDKGENFPIWLDAPPT